MTHPESRSPDPPSASRSPPPPAREAIDVPASTGGTQASTPGRDDSIMASDKLAEAKDYNRREFQCDLLDRALDLGYLSVFAFLAGVPLDHWLQQFPALTTFSARLLVMYLILTGLHVLVSLPLSYYSGHVLEHQYQLSRQSSPRWLWRYVKRHLLTLVFGSLTTLGLYWIIWLCGPSWWLVAAAAYFALSVLLGQLAPVLILPLFYKIEPLDQPELSERFAKISAGTGLAIEGVYRMQMSDETAKANAMLAGLGRTRRVILGDTLLDGFSADEVDVIFAHEIGHHVHRHVPKLIATGLIYSVVGFFICDRLLRVWVGAIDGSLVYSELPIYTLPLLTWILTLFFMLVEPLQNTMSRRFEREADAYALQRTQRADAYRSAFTKLAALNKADPQPNRWEVLLLHSHPPIAERLAMADRMAPAVGPTA